MNTSDAESEVSHEQEECNKFTQEAVSEDINIVNEVDLSDTEVLETEIYMQDKNQDSINRTDDSQCS